MCQLESLKKANKSLRHEADDQHVKGHIINYLETCGTQFGGVTVVCAEVFDRLAVSKKTLDPLRR